MSRRRDAGFTLLEVLVAMVILSVAVVTLIQLASQGLRLLRLSGEHQEAVMLADRLVREGDVSSERVETGREGAFQWERRTARVAVPDDFALVGAPAPRLVALTVAVSWGKGRSVGVATLRVAEPEGQAKP
jgi:general secretion pathway protein I